MLKRRYNIMIRLLINGNVDLRNFQFQSHGVHNKWNEQSVLYLRGDRSKMMMMILLTIVQFHIHIIFALNRDICRNHPFCLSNIFTENQPLLLF